MKLCVIYNCECVSIFQNRFAAHGRHIIHLKDKCIVQLLSYIDLSLPVFGIVARHLCRFSLHRLSSFHYLLFQIHRYGKRSCFWWEGIGSACCWRFAELSKFVKYLGESRSYLQFVSLPGMGVDAVSLLVKEHLVS